ACLVAVVQVRLRHERAEPLAGGVLPGRAAAVRSARRAVHAQRDDPDGAPRRDGVLVAPVVGARRRDAGAGARTPGATAGARCHHRGGAPDPGDHGGGVGLMEVVMRVLTLLVLFLAGLPSAASATW